MAIIEIDGVGRVEVGNEFLKLSPEQQNATVQEIAASAKPQQGTLARLAEPVTSYPETYNQMQREGRVQMAEGVQQLTEAAPPFDPVKDAYPPDSTAMRTAKGVGNVALGALGYVASPVNAALRTVVGKPVEDVTGVPKEYTEFAASMALPIPKRVPAASAAKVPTTQEITRAAGQGYKELRGTGIEFSPETTGALADHLVATMRSKGAYEHLAEPVHKTVGILRKEGPTSVDEVKSVLEALSGLRADPDSKIRRAAGIATTEIKQFLGRTEPGAADTLETATKNYAAASRAKEVETAQEIAGLRAGRAGYGGNAVNSMRQVLSPIVQRAIEGNSKGFSVEEIRAMREIVEGTTATNALRGVGQLSPAKGAIQTGLAIGTAGGSAVIGAVANKLATVLTSRQIDRLDELIRKRSPAYENAVSGAVSKYTAAADDFAVSPSQQNFVRALVASRALASGLGRDGISISSGDLLRAIQGPVKGTAEDEEPAVPRGPGQ